MKRIVSSIQRIMGNAPASLGIVINEQSVRSGGPMSGCVYLQVAKRCVANTLQVVIGGIEYGEVHYTTTHSTGHGKHRSTKTTHHTARSTKSLLFIDLPLASFPSGAVEPGRYEYPFSAVLPPGLPSSMSASGGKNKCGIHYSVTVRLSRPGITKWDVTTKVPFILLAQALPASGPLYAQPKTTPINLCCCCGRGSMTVGAVVNETVLGRGQTVGVGIAVKNESSVKVGLLYVQIKEIVTWSAQGHGGSVSRELARAEFSPQMIDGVTELSKDARKARRLDAESMYQTSMELYETLMSGKQRSDLTILSDARDTYVGEVLSVRHFVRVVLTTPALMTTPTLSVPVRIQEHPGAEPAAGMLAAVPFDAEEKAAITSLPSDWNNALVAEPSVLPMGGAVVGGVLCEADEESPDTDAELGMFQTAQLEASAQTEVATMDALLQMMDRTVDALTLIRGLLEQGDAPSGESRSWRSLFSGLNPVEFSQIVGKVQLEFDQARVAELLAGTLKTLTHAHILTVIRKVSEAQRVPVVNALVPLCADLSNGTNRNVISNELTMWERILTQAVLSGEFKI